MNLVALAVAGVGILMIIMGITGSYQNIIGYQGG